MDKSHLDEVLPVGGSSRVPRIQRILSEFFSGKALITSGVHPEEAAACGAALEAASLAGTAEILLLPVSPLSLGIETSDGIMASLVKCNATLSIATIEPVSLVY